MSESRTGLLSRAHETRITRVSLNFTVFRSVFERCLLYMCIRDRHGMGTTA
ncbi:hypothetical protein [Streptomyces resistomycificus]|uniref:hypothetical protein n=1 Tax=Streptomyces resistomycificus TaxID=67356 RepID=UPI000AC45073|nr:hypothetical protein [Streptomyces resistomycificus]